MGGRAKGLMRTPEGVTIVDRWLSMLAREGLPVVLVGRCAEYDDLGIEVIGDEPAGIGPLGGLVALLRRAAEMHVLALACDMPFVSSRVVERLLGAPNDQAIVAPRREGRWEPLCARYDSRRVLPIAQARATTASSNHSLQRLLDEAGAVELGLSSDEEGELRDWDTPGDVGAP
jgi:molybdenum cofactor guanylyltransferase